MRARLAAAVAAAVLLSAPAAWGAGVPASGGSAPGAPGAPAAHRAAGHPRAEPVGGALLGTDGVVVRRLAGAPPLPGGLDMGSWLVADADTGAVLAAKAPHERFLPASTLKTLTALTLIPLLSPDQTQQATYADTSVDGSKVGLVSGYRYTVQSLFTAMLVVSGNDAAGALAEAAGGLKHTVELMNAEAQRLQAYDTVAMTPSGLDAPGESSSAYDLALIARAGLALPAFRSYVGTVHAQFPAPRRRHFQIYTHNRLLTTYPGDIGVKNGYTVKAGATYVGAATRGGHTIIVTLMHARPDFWPQARQLLDWGFAADGKVSPVGMLADPVDPQAGAVTTAVAARPVSAATRTGGGTDTGGGVPVWEVLALAVSAAAAVTASVGRLRRRSRLTLPPL